MCLIALAYHHHPHYPLIVAANRDEFLDRPAAAANYWEDAPHILAGRDLKAGGTWMGITRHGRFAALTNYRDLRLPSKKGPSRGLLVRQALDGGIDLEDTGLYEGFNMIQGPIDALQYHNNIQPTSQPIAFGIHGLSNHFLNTSWPKVERAKIALERTLALPEDEWVAGLFGLLADDRPAVPTALPDTGLSAEMEHAVSSIFIDSPGYGTRCSTILLVKSNGEVHFEERTIRTGERVIESFTLH